MVSNWIWIFFHRHIPFLSQQRPGNCFVRLSIINFILMSVRDRSYSIHGNHIFKFLILENKFCRVCQPPSVVLVTTVRCWLPSIAKLFLKARQFSSILPLLWRPWRWIIIQWLPRLTFGTFIIGWLLLCGLGFHNDITVEVFIYECIICSIRCSVPLAISSFHICRVAKHLGHLVIHKVPFSQYAVPKNYAQSCSVIQYLLFLLQSEHEIQACGHKEKHQKWLPPVPGLREYYRLLIALNHRAWDRLSLRLQQPSTALKVRHHQACMVRTPWSCSLPIPRLY